MKSPIPPLTGHGIALTPASTAGYWRTYCPGCSELNGDYVEACWWGIEWPRSTMLAERKIPG